MDSKLRLNRVTQSIGKTRIISDLTMNVPAGQVYGFLGRNGAGKSTIMKIILGLLRPDSGTVELDGVPVNDTDTRYLSRIGSLIEEPSFYPNLTGVENIEYLSGLRGVATNPTELLGIVGLAAHGHRKAGEYSLGMKQRLGIAFTLVGDPEILLLDEPTNGLDPDGIREIRELLLRFSRDMGKTVVISSHILSEIEQVADIVGIIDQGSLKFEGELGDLIGTPSLVLDPLDSIAASAVLAERGIDFSRGTDDRLQLPYSGRKSTASLITELVQSEVALASATVRQHTLENAFLTLTGDHTSVGSVG